jgi:hypothetical protein
MIVRKEPDGSLILIAQTNHAELSGFFAANWGNEMFARPRPHQSVVLAAIYHDAGWYKYEGPPGLRCRDPIDAELRAGSP